MPVFLFTDIQGSTQLWEIHGGAMGAALQQHDTLVRRCVERHGGRVIKHTGDGIFAVFEAGDPLHCAVEIQERMAAADWETVGALHVRVALHSGEAERRKGDYFGSAVNRTARLLAAAWGGQILLSEEVLEEQEVPADAVLVDHGVHMLKDLGRPQHIYGLLPRTRIEDRFPPLRSLSSHAHNLPPQPTPFIDRRVELGAVIERLDNPGCRLLTLIGPGGIGKTRLALQVGAERIEGYAHGVFQVPLASVSSPSTIYSTIGDALRFPFAGPQPPEEQLHNYLREKEMLLILDNFEHLIEGAPVVSDLLAHSPRLNVLVTSRERLNLQEEWTYQIQGMPVPGPGEVNGFEQYSAVQLFLQGANRISPAFAATPADRQHIARICRMIEGIPLGIELASSWLRVLTCAEIAQEIAESRDFLVTTLRDVPRRHQSLRAVFDYSWRLLSSDEQRLLRQLSIFRGGFERDAARAVAGASLPALMSLTDKSLIRHSPSGRYEMLETIRQYAEEKLQEEPSELAATEERHCLYYTNLLYQRKEDLKGGQQKVALAELEAEIENARKAWQFAINSRWRAAIDRGLQGIFHFYEMRGLLQEGVELFQQALDTFAGAPHTADEELTRARLLLRRGWFAYRLGDNEQAQRDMEAGLATCRRLDEKREASFALYNLGILSYQLGQYTEAEEYLAESLALRRAIDYRFGIARALSILGIVARDQGQQEKAWRLLQESLDVHREIEDGRGISRCLNVLALLHRDSGDKETARDMLEESVVICRENEDRAGSAFAASILGAILYEVGDYARAREMSQESLEIREEMGDRRGITFSLNDLGNAMAALGQYERAEHYFRRALQTALAIKAEPLALYVLSGVAALRARQGQPQKALELAALICAHPSSFEMAVDKAQGLCEQLKEQLGAEAVASAETDADPNQFDAVVAAFLGTVS